jgi:hypothetical protein
MTMKAETTTDLSGSATVAEECQPFVFAGRFVT